MTTILADGQCHYAFHVETHAGQGEAVLHTLKEWKAGVRAAEGFGVASVEDLCDKVVCQVIENIMLEIWIPLWGAGLRFKDCHPGNFILGADGHVYMIDTEQIRKDAAELLLTPDNWTQCNRHEELGLTRLPGLITRLIRAARPDCKEATTGREVRRLLDIDKIPELLKRLSRGDSHDAAKSAVGAFMDGIRRQWE